MAKIKKIILILPDHNDYLIDIVFDGLIELEAEGKLNFLVNNSKNYLVGKSKKKIFNWKEVENILERHINKKEYNLTILWAILTFQFWARKYKIKF